MFSDVEKSKHVWWTCHTANSMFDFPGSLTRAELWKPWEVRKKCLFIKIGLGCQSLRVLRYPQEDRIIRLIGLAIELHCCTLANTSNLGCSCSAKIHIRCRGWASRPLVLSPTLSAICDHSHISKSHQLDQKIKWKAGNGQRASRFTNNVVSCSTLADWRITVSVQPNHSCSSTRWFKVFAHTMFSVHSGDSFFLLPEYFYPYDVFQPEDFWISISFKKLLISHQLIFSKKVSS